MAKVLCSSLAVAMHPTGYWSPTVISPYAIRPAMLGRGKIAADFFSSG